MAKPPLPAETRWTSLRESIQYFVANWGRLHDIFTSLQRSKTAEEERINLADQDLRRFSEDILSILDSVMLALNTTQSDGCNLADAYSAFIKLRAVKFCFILILYNIQMLYYKNIFIC